MRLPLAEPALCLSAHKALGLHRPCCPVTGIAAVPHVTEDSAVPQPGSGRRGIRSHTHTTHTHTHTHPISPPFPTWTPSRATHAVPPTLCCQVLKTCAPAPTTVEVLFNSYPQLRVSESWKEVIPEEVFQVSKLPLLPPLAQGCCLFLLTRVCSFARMPRWL